MKSLFTRAAGACLLAYSALVPFSVAAADDPLTLRTAISAALANNPKLASFEFEFRAQDARAKTAGLKPAPEVSVEAENFLGTGDFGGAKAADFTFALSQVIELGGKRDARVAAAEAARSSLEIERQAQQLEVLAEVTRRFIDVAARQEQVRVARKAVELATQTVAGSEKRVNAAKSPHSEFDRSKIALDRAKLNERSAIVELDAARKQLAATWGESQYQIDGKPLGLVKADLFTLPDSGDFPTLAARLSNSPDFLKFASEARLRDAEVRLATTMSRPDIALSGGVRRLQESSDQAFVAGFSMPLFSSSRAQSQIAEAEAMRGLVDSERKAAEVKAKATLYELHRQLARSILEANVLQTDILPRMEEALKETDYAFSRGRYSYLELVDAQREYLEVQAAVIESAANAHTLRAEIERLTNQSITAP